MIVSTLPLPTANVEIFIPCAQIKNNKKVLLSDKNTF